MTKAIMETLHVTLPRADFSELGNGAACVEDMTDWVARRFYGSYMVRPDGNPFRWEVFMPSYRVGNAIKRFKSFGFTVELAAVSIWVEDSTCCCTGDSEIDNS